MLREFVINVFALISILFFFAQITRNNPLTFQSSLRSKTGLGLLAGGFSIVLMYFSLHVTDKTIVDLRLIPVMLMALLGGLYPALIAAVVVGIARIAFFGVSTSSITAAISSVMLALVSSLIVRLLKGKSPTFQMRVMSLYHIVHVSLLLFILVGDTAILMNVLPYFWLFAFVGAEIAAYLTLYLQASNEMFRRFREQASKDFLTGLRNVRSFDATLNQNLDEARERGERLSLLYVDIDHFEHVNDTYGHPAGDEVLKQLGSILTTTVRSFDTVSRNGGEEFSAILADCPHPYALEIGERVRAAVEGHSFALPDGQHIRITVSVGVATYPDTATSSAELLQQADDGLYTAKRTGRNKVCSTA